MLKRLQFLTSGESHGKGLLGILDGLPAGLEINEEYIDRQLKRRQMGHGRGGRMKIEKDHAQIWGGVRHGLTLGSPIGILIDNLDWKNWTKISNFAKIAVFPRKNYLLKNLVNLKIIGVIFFIVIPIILIYLNNTDGFLKFRSN